MKFTCTAEVGNGKSCYKERNGIPEKCVCFILRINTHLVALMTSNTNITNNSKVWGKIKKPGVDFCLFNNLTFVWLHISVCSFFFPDDKLNLI